MALKDQRIELASKIRHVGPRRGSTPTLFIFQEGIIDFFVVVVQIPQVDEIAPVRRSAAGGRPAPTSPRH